MNELESQTSKPSKCHRYFVYGMADVEVLRISKRAQSGQIWVWKADIPLLGVHTGDAYGIDSCREGKNPDDSNRDSDAVSQCSVTFIGGAEISNLIPSSEVAGYLD